MKDCIHIIIPVYNHTRVLGKALASILAQTYRPLQVTVVDDGSDEPVSSAHCSILGDIPYRIIRQTNTGAPAARNRGLKEVSEPYLIFWDADAVAIPSMLAAMHAALQEHATVSYAYTDFKFGFKTMHAQTFDPEILKRRNYIHTTSLLRTCDAELWDESLKRFQDWDYWLTLWENKKTGIYIPGTFFKVVPRSSGMSAWLPRCAYHSPLRHFPGISRRVKSYERARLMIQQKHSIVL